MGLNAIVLAPAEDNTAGWHTTGVVAVCAWERELWTETSVDFYESHRALFERLGVPCERQRDGWIQCQWTEETVRAFQLLHILLHELGHHHDRITTRSSRRAARGEPYAENYAYAHEAEIWDRYWSASRSRKRLAGPSG